jgi:N6-L-threonylcarbamoyladenine synthase
MAFAAGIPLISGNHLEGHIYANSWNTRMLSFPFWPFWYREPYQSDSFRGHLDYEVLGRTRDDAAGEAFDKVARTLGLDTLEVPIFSSCRPGNDQAFDLPRAMLEAGSIGLSFSGLKSQFSIPSIP